MATTLTIHEFNNSRINNSSPPPNATFLTHGNGHGSEGLKKANSTKFFTLFGEYRIDPPDPEDDITDRGFTGHKHDDDIELIYMNARYYVPYINRFLSADTIIPDQTDPQSFNRYSYTLNNPLKYIDPSGHCAETGDDGCWTTAEGIWVNYGISLDALGQLSFDQLNQLLTWLERGFQFEGNWSSGGLQNAITSLDYALNAIGDWQTMSALMGMQNGESFSLIIDPSIGGGEALPEQNYIKFGAGDSDVTLFLHEMGHIVDYNMARLSGMNTRFWSDTALMGLGWGMYDEGWRDVPRLVTDEYSPFSTASPNEDFADTFAAWVLTENVQPLPSNWRPLTLERYQALTVALDQIQNNLP